MNVDELIKYIDEIMSVTDDRNLELVKRKIQQLIKQTNDTTNTNIRPT